MYREEATAEIQSDFRDVNEVLRNQNTRNEKRTTLTKLDRKVAIEKSKHIDDL